MKIEEIYKAWQEEKRQIEIHKEFSDEVMDRIYQYEREKRKSLFDIQQLIELISAHSLAKAGLVAAGAVTGLVRIAFVVCTFLRT